MALIQVRVSKARLENNAKEGAKKLAPFCISIPGEGVVWAFEVMIRGTSICKTVDGNAWIEVLTGGFEYRGEDGLTHERY